MFFSLFDWINYSFVNNYKKYGKATNCRNGKGGGWANDVYRITGAIVTLPPTLPSNAGKLNHIPIHHQC